MGFVQSSGKSAPKQSGPATTADSGVIAVPVGGSGGGSSASPASFRKRGLHMTQFQVGLGGLELVPTNGGDNDPHVDLGLFEVQMALRHAGRSEGSMLGFWVDVHASAAFGDQTLQSRDNLKKVAGKTLGSQDLLFDARVGLDLHPIPLLGVGPMIGGSLHLLRADVQYDLPPGLTEPDAPSAKFQPDLAVLYGGHLHLVIGSEAFPRVYAEPMFWWRKGKHVTSPYVGLEAGVRIGSWLVLWGRLERRVGASGSFSYDDASTPSKYLAASGPELMRYGGGIGFKL